MADIRIVQSAPRPYLLQHVPPTDMHRLVPVNSVQLCHLVACVHLQGLARFVVGIGVLSLDLLDLLGLYNARVVLLVVVAIDLGGLNVLPGWVWYHHKVSHRGSFLDDCRPIPGTGLGSGLYIGLATVMGVSDLGGF